MPDRPDSRAHEPAACDFLAIARKAAGIVQPNSVVSQSLVKMFALSYFAKVCLAHAKVRPSVAAS